MMETIKPENKMVPKHSKSNSNRLFQVQCLGSSIILFESKNSRIADHIPSSEFESGVLRHRQPTKHTINTPKLTNVKNSICHHNPPSNHLLILYLILFFIFIYAKQSLFTILAPQKNYSSFAKIQINFKIRKGKAFFHKNRGALTKGSKGLSAQ